MYNFIKKLLNLLLNEAHDYLYIQRKFSVSQYNDSSQQEKLQRQK